MKQNFPKLSRSVSSVSGHPSLLMRSLERAFSAHAQSGAGPLPDFAIAP